MRKLYLTITCTRVHDVCTSSVGSSFPYKKEWLGGELYVQIDGQAVV